MCKFYFYVLLVCCFAFNLHAEINIVPKPVSVMLTESDKPFPSKISVYVGDEEMSQQYVLSVLEEMGFTPSISNKRSADILFFLNKKRSKSEAYQLILGKKIEAKASSTSGLLNALQTLRQVVERKDHQLYFPTGIVNDAPAFHWRAFMLDESRHFQGMDMVKRLIDEMARLKMNVFHWHLVDDPGWRIEIKKYPLLTQVGSRRDFSHREMSVEEFNKVYPYKRMYYTQEEITEVVRYAAARGIQILPEIEIPGHASASILAYPWLGSTSRKEGKPIWGDLYQVFDPKVENFIRDVVDEVLELFPFGILHIGGDEAAFGHWEGSKEATDFMKENNLETPMDLQLWAINRMSTYLNKKDCRMIGWNEITGDNIRNEKNVKESRSVKLLEGTIVQFWDGDIGLVNKAIDKGYNVVNSNRFYTYLDYPYETTPLEKAYSFNPIPEGLNAEDEAKIYGLGCQMWGEFIPTPERVYCQTFPRLAAYAECGWTKNENKDYKDFCRRVQPIQKIWEQKGFFTTQPRY